MVKMVSYLCVCVCMFVNSYIELPFYSIKIEIIYETFNHSPNWRSVNEYVRMDAKSLEADNIPDRSAMAYILRRPVALTSQLLSSAVSFSMAQVFTLRQSDSAFNYKYTYHFLS